MTLHRFGDGLMTAIDPGAALPGGFASPHSRDRATALDIHPVTVNSTFASPWRDGFMPEPAAHPELFEGVLRRRAAAYLIDAFCIALIAVAVLLVFAVLTVLSLGLLAPGLWFLFGLIPLGYHTLLVGGRHGATFGMRAFDLELRSSNGARPMFLQALAHAALFYLTVGATCFLVLLFVLFNRRKRTLHDVLTGMLMVRGHIRSGGNR
jgi:uncharacterized RDD family membrane protein YckC